MMRINPRIIMPVLGSAALIALPFIKVKEGTVLIAEPDPIGIATGCHGYTKNVYIGQVFTPAECHVLLAQEIAIADAVVDRYVNVPLPDKRRAAYISLIYNIGEGNFSKSTLLRKTNAGDQVGACRQFLRWVYAGGRKLKGLVVRREEEYKMCMEGLGNGI